MCLEKFNRQYSGNISDKRKYSIYMYSCHFGRNFVKGKTVCTAPLVTAAMLLRLINCRFIFIIINEMNLKLNSFETVSKSLKTVLFQFHFVVRRTV